MNTPLQILRFKGPLRQVAGPGPAGITLLGELVESDGRLIPAQLSLLGHEPVDLPSPLTDVTVDMAAAPVIVLRSASQQGGSKQGGSREWRISCRTWQLHRDVGAMFYAAVPPRPTPWTRRLIWRVLFGIAATAPGRWWLSRRSRAK